MDLLVNFHANVSAYNMNENEHIKLNATDVTHIMEYVKGLEKERDLKDYEVENCKMQIKYLFNDIDVLEDLYKSCVEEMMKQENIISSLRKCYLEHREEEINWRTENALLQSKLDSLNNMLSNSSTTAQEDIQVIKTQLRDLQCLLKMEVAPIQIVSSNKCQSRTNPKLIRKLSRLKSTAQKQSAIIASCNAIISQNKRHMKDMRRMFFDKNCCGCTHLENSIKTTEKFESIEKQFTELKSVMGTLQEYLKDSQDNSTQVTNQCNELLKSHLYMGEQMKHEHSTVLWLESELQESTTKGAEICCESKQIFGNLKNWLHLVKKERRSMLIKIKELRCFNKILLQRLNGEDVTKI